MKPARTWIVVADGTQARVFLNQGPGEGFGGAPIHEMAITLAADRDLTSDRPGRGRVDASRRHGMEPRVDWHEAEKERFIKTVAEHLDRAAGARSFDRLVLAAPSKMLGTLRRALGRHASDLVIGELPKDLTHVAPKDLPGHFETIFNP